MSDQDVIDRCLDRFKLAVDARSRNRASQLEDLKFAAGEQWPSDIAQNREQESRPCLTINKTDTFVRQVVNQMRQQRPQIVVHPVNDGADQKVAEIIEGLIRHIQVNSNADSAYDTGADFQVRMGEGYCRITTRYEREDSFDQEIYIDRIRNPFTVYFDPSSTLPDGSDAEWCIITEMMRRDQFESKYPNADISGWSQRGAGDDTAEWTNQEEVRIAEYFTVEREPDTLCLMSDGRTAWKSRLPSMETMQASQWTVVSERPSYRRKVMWYKLTLGKLLDKREWPGRFIPVIPFYGAEQVIDGKVDRYGMVRHLRDPQRMYNYWRTAETEVVALSPKAPWLVADEQIEGYESVWNMANQKSFAYLTYKPITHEGNPVPPPQRNAPVQVPAGIVEAAQAANDDLKHVSGIFDPSLGAQGNETSGIAIANRQGQSDVSNFHFYDNQTRSIRWIGKLLLDLIPKIYDTKRIIRIIGADGSPKSVTINDPQESEAIKTITNDVRVGTFDVVMDTGPGFQTKRIQAAESMIESMRVVPQIGQVAADLIIRNMDWPGAQQIADRLAAANPIANIEKELPDDVPPQAKALIAKQSATIQQLTQKVQAMQIEHSAKMEVEKGWQETELKKAHIQADTRMHDVETRAITARDVEEIKGMVELLAHHMKVPLELQKAAAKNIGDKPRPGPQ